MKFLNNKVNASLVGFESPANDYKKSELLIDDLLVNSPSSTFLALAVDDDNKHQGIFNGDVLIIDKSLKPKKMDLVYANYDGTTLIKEVMPSNHSRVIGDKDDIEHFDELIVKGVITFVLRIHKMPVQIIKNVVELISRNLTLKQMPQSLHELLIQNSHSTFIARASGHSMSEVGINDNDFLIIDRKELVETGNIAVINFNGLLACKILDIKNKRLISASQKYPAHQITDSDTIQIEGLVTFSIKQFR